MEGLNIGSARIQDFDYLYASNTNVSNFVSVNLSGNNNYLLWKAQMLCLLESRNMRGIVDANFDGPKDSMMRQYDSLLRGWIFGSVSEDVLVGVFNLDSATTVWEKLQSMYDPSMCLRQDSISINSETHTKELEGTNSIEIDEGNADVVSAEPNTFEEEEIEIILGKDQVSRDESVQESDEVMINEQKNKIRKATIKGDWLEVKSILKENADLATMAISSDGSTILHIAVGTCHNDIVRNLILQLKDVDVLQRRESDGSTSLHIAAIVGNKDAADLLVKKNPHLLLIKDLIGEEPLHKAYENMHLDTVGFLLQAISDAKTELQSSFPGFADHPSEKIAVELLVNAISAKQYSLASRLVQMFPEFVSKSDDVLMAIAKTFPSGLDDAEALIHPSQDYFSGITFIADWILNHSVGLVFDKFDNILTRVRDKNVIWSVLIFLIGSVPLMLAFLLFLMVVFIVFLCVIFIEIYSIWWGAAKIIIAPMKQIDDKQKEWDEAKDLLEKVCDEIDKLKYHGTHHPYYTRPILEAACQNAYKVVDEILFRSPETIQSRDKNGYDIFQLAIINRSEKIYNLIFDIGERKNNYRTYRDSSQNNMLHLAGKLAPSPVLNKRTGAALQLQRELQWHEEVKKLVFPAYITQENIFNKTPDMIFTREHGDLVKEGEKWMKTTAESCSITAALIITIVFAAAITVPGGSNQKGKPLLKNKTSFIIFAISDAISLFASSTSLLVFLSILTARFAEKDFLVSLPKRLFIGLFSLLLSTTAMTVAFSATLFLVFCDEKLWMLAPICGLAFIPIASFVGLQFPLMVDLFKSTYIGIFGKQRKWIPRRFNPDEIRLRFRTTTIGNKLGASTMREKNKNDKQDIQLVKKQSDKYSRINNKK